MKDTNTILQEIFDYIQECREEGDTDLRSILHFVEGKMIKEDKKQKPKITLKKYLKINPEPYDWKFDKILKDEEGENLDFENYDINSVDGNILKISHGGDWQEPKQAIYEFDGVDTLKLVGEGGEPKFS